ncbi:MAG: hypothetical protein H6Q73_4468, partial [Firmicutes bacterium]|nr:hypothetical protein [Bacillota bacterium]
KAVFEKQKYTKLVAEKSDTLRQQHPEWNEKEIDWNAKYQVLIEKCGNLLGEEREQFVRDHLPEFKAYYDSGNNVINDLNYQGVNDVKSLIGEINIDPLSPATVDSQPEENYTIHPDSFGVNRRYNNQGIMHSDDLVSYFALDSAIRGALPTEEFLDKLDSASTALMFSVPGGQVEGLLGKLAAGLGKGSLMISRAPKVVIEAEEAVAKKSVEVTKVAGQIGRYTGELIHVNKADAAADLLAERIGGQSRVKFASDSIGREFDAVSNEYIAQTKPALQTLNKSVRDQMKATFEAAQETGKKVYYHFEGQPAKSVIDKLCEYSQRYGIEVIIDIKPLK